MPEKTLATKAINTATPSMMPSFVFDAPITSVKNIGNNVKTMTEAVLQKKLTHDIAHKLLLLRVLLLNCKKQDKSAFNLSNKWDMIFDISFL